MAGIETPSPDPDPRRTFADRRGFFRASAGAGQGDPLDTFVVEDGPPFEEDEARAVVRRFLDLLADGRPTEDHPEPLEHAQRNGLLLLFGPAEQQRFEALYPRLPPEMAAAWREALGGGRAVDAFGPVDAREAIDEQRVERALAAARRRRRSLIVLGVVVVVGLIGAGASALAARDGTAGGVGTIRFGPVAGGDPDDPEGRAGPPPSVSRDLLVRLDRPVAVATGQGDVTGRIVLDPSGEDLPVAPGAVAATLFRYRNTAQVVLVGPPGWLEEACVQVSAVSEGLRALDTVRFEQPAGACAPEVFGREPAVGCASEDTVMLGLVLPDGEVPLVEGGTATVGGVRVAVHGRAEGYERISMNGRIEVPGGTEVQVPTFGGEEGATVDFDVSEPTGAPVTGSCTLR